MAQSLCSMQMLVLLLFPFSLVKIPTSKQNDKKDYYHVPILCWLVPADVTSILTCVLHGYVSVGILIAGKSTVRTNYVLHNHSQFASHLPHPVKHFGNIFGEYATRQSLLYFVVVTYSLFKALSETKQE